MKKVVKTLKQKLIKFFPNFKVQKTISELNERCSSYNDNQKYGDSFHQTKASPTDQKKSFHIQAKTIILFCPIEVCKKCKSTTLINFIIACVMT